jgi:hypothetical protein
MTRTEAASARLAACWTRVYTAGLPAPVRDRRRAEIDADVHGQLEDARIRREQPVRTAAAMTGRMVRGAWHDLSWRHEASRPERAVRWQARRGWWIACVLLATLGAGVLWLSHGLALRSGGDRLPLRLAARAAGQLASGSPPGGVLPPAVNMASSPAAFVMVFDSSHHVLASSGRLGGRIPQLPGGVLSFAAAHGEDRITWEPAPGLREAAVIEPYGGPRPGFILAAQSLQVISRQQLSVIWGIAGGWLAVLAISLAAARLLPARARPRRPGRGAPQRG